MYEDSYTTSWGLSTTSEGGETTSEKLVALGYERGQEKARYIDCKNSNKYNITQDIAEAFEVFCQYEYTCDVRGRFKKEYTEDGKHWTGRKVIFYNRAIKTDKPATIEYKKNLNTIQRTKDSSEIYTKLYITPIESSTMDTGYISIADTPLNPTLDDFILNFDYLYQTKAVSQYQLNCVKTYEVETYKINQQLINLAPTIENLTTHINDLESNLTMAQNEKSSAQKMLEEYQILRDSEVRNTPVQKNKDNSFSVVFVEDGDIKKAAFRLYGIEKTSIKGFSNYTYSNSIFSYEDGDIIEVNSIGSVASDDARYYLVLDEYGYPTYIYTSKDNIDFTVDNSSIIYFELMYNPHNAYADICTQLVQRIENKNYAITDLEKSIEDLQKSLDEYEAQQDDLLKQKELLNQRLEVVLGPALREGYWTPDSYEDPGESRMVESIERSDKETGVVLTFDTKVFDGENLNYYYADNNDLDDKNKTYYPYIDISEIYEEWEDKNIENLTLHLQNPYLSFKTESTISAGNYFIIYDNTKYYYALNQIRSSSVLTLTVNEDSIPCINVDKGNINYIGTTEPQPDATNITDKFGGINLYLGERLLYNDAGFIFGFLKNKYEEIKPVLVLNNLNISYDRYKKISYSFSSYDKIILKDNNDPSIIITKPSDGWEFCYPRIVIYESNVNHKSDTLKIIPYKQIFTEETQKLANYEDYTILIRGGRPHITLKITKENNLNTIMNWHYRIEYRISRANEMLYLDAKNVARDNAYPKYSYELKIANTPKDIDFYELGQLVYINDYSMGIHAASGYVSEITLCLDKAQDDEVKIKNYKTKFEDLFSTITASSEAMRNNQVAYNIAANGFNSDGTIEGSVLQNSILNNNISMNYSNTNVEIDDVNGIVLTNQQPYLNGVYGQVKLMGGGIFLSNAIDASGARIWNTGITPNGINAALINAGQLDVNKVRVFAGNNVAFQWNSEGIFAYKQDEGSVDLNTYVRYSDKGLQFVSGDHTAVDLGWNGLLISTQDGSTELSGKYGLTIYDGIKQYHSGEDFAYNHVVRLGKFEDGTYGLKLYKNDGNDNYKENLITTNNGELWLKDSLLVGSLEEITWENENGELINGQSAAGIFGGINSETANESIRFWAGRDEDHMRIAPFQVWQDGTLIANKATITGTIYANDGVFTGTINAASGTIGGWDIGEDTISTDGIVLQAHTENKQASITVGDVNSDSFVQITEEGSLVASGAVINGTINATGGSIGNLDIEDLNTSLKTTTVEITSSNGSITKYGEDFETIFTATIKKGGIALNDEAHNDYDYAWQSSLDGNIWNKLIDSDNSRYVNYNEKHTTQQYVRCLVSKKEVGENG